MKGKISIGGGKREKDTKESSGVMGGLGLGSLREIEIVGGKVR